MLPRDKHRQRLGSIDHCLATGNINAEQSEASIRNVADDDPGKCQAPSAKRLACGPALTSRYPTEIGQKLPSAVPPSAPNGSVHLLVRVPYLRRPLFAVVVHSRPAVCPGLFQFRSMALHRCTAWAATEEQLSNDRRPMQDGLFPLIYPAP